ncbi:hypothetical protein FEF30_02900, partial [Mesomycoplasma hyopneumoniae]
MDFNQNTALAEREREQGERALKSEFYNTYFLRVDKNLSIDQIQNNYTDGIINGNILEFKLNITNLNSTLFQVIKYLSRLRIKGIPVPKNIFLISLMENKAFSRVSHFDEIILKKCSVSRA